MVKDTTDWKFNLGDRVLDRVSRFKGIICIRQEHLNGCKQYGIYPEVDKEGKVGDAHLIDGEQLELIDKGLNETKSVVKKQTGSAPTRIPSSKI
jgi:hypothetical protein